MRWKESPDKNMKGPPGYAEKVMNAAFRIGETQLMADDGMGEKTAEFKGMTLCIEVADDVEAKRVFMALGEGGKVTMPLAKTFWTSSFGMLTDKFGVPGMVNVEAPKSVTPNAGRHAERLETWVLFEAGNHSLDRNR